MTKQLPKRNEVAVKDTWDLSSLFADDRAWQTEFELLEQEIDLLGYYKGRLKESSSIVPYNIPINQL